MKRRIDLLAYVKLKVMRWWHRPTFCPIPNLALLLKDRKVQAGVRILRSCSNLETLKHHHHA
jgi:hypothetical protein